MTTGSARTPLYDWHLAHGGRMVDFAGWAMPVQYTSIVAEHRATRTAAGLYDISHMGRIRFDGPSAAAFLNSLVTRNVGDLTCGQLHYSLVTNDEGGVLDDVLVGRFCSATGESFHLVVCNASNRRKILAWIDAHLPDRQSVPYTDCSFSWGMIAVQGPKSQALLQPFVATNLDTLKYYGGAQTEVAGRWGLVSRTGYTGEDGFEVLLPAEHVPGLWQSLYEAGLPMGVLPTGLGCRDTLRLEAGMPLYGHELTESINPFQAGLGSAVDLEKGPFPGRDALARLKQDRSLSKRVGLEFQGRRIARQGCKILASGEPVGEVASGTFSPTLEKSIAMGYIRPELARPGTELAVEIRDSVVPGRIVRLPFYRRAQ
jgi:aminomethyltransferase